LKREPNPADSARDAAPKRADPNQAYITFISRACVGGDTATSLPPTRVNPENLVGINGRSHVVILDRVSRLAFVSGQVSMNSGGMLIGKGDFEVQTRQVFQNLLIILREIGGTLDDVVKLNAYTTVPEQVQTYLKVRNEFVSKKNPPASTLVGVIALASPDFLIEVEMIVVLKS
jgi:enamine deaminase RidA (YjgF/YER057c/UK114 family)